MKRVSILVPESVVMEAVANPRYLFTAVNQFWQAKGAPPPFQVELVGQTQEVPVLDGIYTIRTDRQPADIDRTDLIIIPALFGDMREALEKNKAFLPWIVQQRKRGAELASLCLGAFLLASSGLLDGRKCSTHWAFVNEFRKMFPAVQLRDGAVITDEQGIYSSGGANSYWNLLLYLVEKYTDRDTAILAAKYFAVDIDRESQSAFMMFSGQKNHVDTQILQAQEFIEQRFSEKISVEELADAIAVGRRSFERRFKKATGNTVLEYLQRVKIEAAKRSFESSRKNVNEVMFDVGYTDTKAFRDVFKKITGLTPVEYRNKYNKGA
ncbi:MAG: helix-turn-helix domain-containing protein [Saprospiraceae bacterium]|nr:helix-turn-helix domain-containing protein [Saprospiraceae bacterium]